MTDNYPTQPLNTRPKVHDNTAVDEWLKDNKPTVLPAFERIAPKSAHKARVDNAMLSKAQSVTNSIKVSGMTYKKFMERCRYDVRTAQQIKHIIKSQCGLTLKVVRHTTDTGKVVDKMELTK